MMNSNGKIVFGFLLYFGFQTTVVVKFIIALDRMILLRHVRTIGLNKTQNVAVLVCSVIIMCAITVVPFILILTENYPGINIESRLVVFSVCLFCSLVVIFWQSLITQLCSCL